MKKNKIKDKRQVVYFLFRYRKSRKAENIFSSNNLTTLILVIKKLMARGVRLRDLAIYYCDSLNDDYRYYKLTAGEEKLSNGRSLTYYDFLLNHCLPAGCFFT